MMNFEYIGVVLLFILILFRKQILPYLKWEKKKKEDKPPALPHLCEVREITLPCYKVLGFRSTDYITIYDLVCDVECKLGHALEEIAEKGGDPSRQIEFMSAGNVLLILLRYPDKKVLYPISPDVKKEGGVK